MNIGFRMDCLKLAQDAEHDINGGRVSGANTVIARAKAYLEFLNPPKECCGNCEKSEIISVPEE